MLLGKREKTYYAGFRKVFETRPPPFGVYFLAGFSSAVTSAVNDANAKRKLSPAKAGAVTPIGGPMIRKWTTPKFGKFRYAAQYRVPDS